MGTEWTRDENGTWGIVLRRTTGAGKQDLGEGAYFSYLGTIRISLFYKLIYNVFLYTGYN
jgi:hypothetical protein